MVKSDIPGSLASDGLVGGFPWGDNRTYIRSVAELRARIDQRLRIRRLTLTLAPAPYVLCHLDLNLRNIMIDEGDQVVLLDWANAAFYPSIFELASLSSCGDAYLLTDEDVVNDYDLRCL
jgi:thiamine kinase-like enzyme